MTEARTVSQNTTYYTAALVMQKALAFVYFVLVARILGVNQTGEYTTALTFTTIFAILIDVGFSSVLTREGAKETPQIQLLFNNIISFKIPAAIITYLIVIFIGSLLYPASLLTLIALAGVMMILDSFSLSFWACYRAFRNLKYESLGVLIFELVKFSGGLFVLLNGYGLSALFIALCLASLTQFSLSLYLCLYKLRLNFKLTFSKDFFRLYFKMAWPFFLAGIFVRLYSQIDTVLVSKISCGSGMNNFCRSNVGWFSIAKKLSDALLFVPMAMTAALYPAMSYYFANNKDKLKSSFEEAVKYLLIISLPITSGIWALSQPLIKMIFSGQYDNSALPLKIIICGLPFMFLTYPIGSLLNACNLQLKNTINIAISSVLMVALNIILIPHYAYLGAAVSIVVGNIFLVILGLRIVPRLISYNKKYLYTTLAKIFIASLLMAMIIVFLVDYLSTLVLLFLGVIIYCLLLFVLKIIHWRDILNLKVILLKTD